MAEDENVDVMAMNTELAERLGVVPSANTGAAPKAGFRARGRSPLLSATAVRCSPACRSRDSDENLLVPELSAFMHMLPQEIISADQQQQALLFRLVFDAGVKAYHHLLTYVIQTGASGTDSASSDSSEASWSTSRAFRDAPVLEQGSQQNARLPSIDSDAENLSMMERIDHAYEAMIEVGDADIIPVGNAPEATPQLVANTLGLFAGAALRRPPTRAVECVMAASQESNTAQSDVDRHDIYEGQPNGIDNFASCEDGLLVLACAAGFVDLVTEILRLRDSTVFTSEIDVTPLMEAAAAGSHTVVKKLIELKADVNSISQTNNTPLIYAAAAGQAECVRLLLATGACDVTVRNENGHDALMEAASSGNVDIVKMLIDVGARPSFLSMHNEFKESPLTLAAYKGHVDVITYLLDLRNTMSDVVYQEEELHTALMEASMDGHYEVARVLLDAGAPPNMVSESFESPLTLACCGGHDVLAKMLLDAGAYIEEPNDESYTPLMEAAREGHVNVVKVLLAHGANVNAQTEETGETALTVAACGGYTDVLQELVEHGGDLELGGNTPLMEAAQEGHAQTVMYIVKASSQPGVCPNFISHASTAVGLAAENGHLDVIEILYTAGADLNTEIDGRTPLMKACKNGNIRIAQYLIGKAVDVNTQSSHQDATALLLACAAGHKEIVKFLLFHGADPNVELKDGISCVLEAARNGFVEIVEMMLDHSGVAGSQSTPSLAKTMAANPMYQAMKTHDKMTVMRKKRNMAAPKGTVPLAAPPDPAVNGPPVYSPSFPASQQYGGQTPESREALGNNPEFAREYYTWLAGVYNNRVSDPSGAIVTVLPPEYTPTQVMSSLDNLQKMLQQLAQSNENWVMPDHMEFAVQRARKQIAQVQKNNMDMVNGVPNPDRPAAGIAATSAKFLASIYELGKKNFAGLPLPKKEDWNKMEAQQSTAFQPTFPPQLNPSPPPIQLPPTNATFAQQAQAASHLNALTMDQMAELMAFFKTNPNGDGELVGTDGLDAALAGEDIITQITATLSPEHRRATKKKFMEIFNNWEEFSEHCRKLCPDLKNQPLSADLSMKAVLEQQTAALNETLKVLRPTVTSLPGGVVVGATSTATIPPVSFPVSNSSPAQNHTLHRRTHSEGDESETLRQNFTSKGNNTCNLEKATESNNDTPLTLACSNGHKDMVSVLVSRGANIEHRDKKGFTPLILAATGGHVGVVEALLAAGAAIEAQSERTKDTALSLACSGGRKEVVELLLSKGANKEHRNVSDYTPLSLAASGGYVEIVNMLLNAGAEINSRTGSKLGISPLMLAAMNGHKDATRVLLEKGSDINAQIETNRNTALTLACFQGRTDVVRLLLQYNANVEHRAKTGLTPLMEAANGGYVEVGELLLENDADPNTTPVPSSRDTALTIAADKGHDKFVEMLIKHDAQIDAKNKKGCTALWLACHGGHLDTVKVLIQHKADVDAQDNRKVSPLMIAFRKGFVRIVTFLVDHVKQYPSDQEMERYMTTLNAGEVKPTKEMQELAKNCGDSMNIIKKAKTAQAEQANKAAEDLLALLAEEEERAKTKKQKKAKKREEKKQKQKEAKGKSPAAGGEDESEEESEIQNTSREEIPAAVVAPDPRVPQVAESAKVIPEVIEEATTKHKKQSRRSRQDAAKAPSSNGTSSTVSALSIATTVFKPSVLSPASPVVAPPKVSPTEEWVKAAPAKKKTTQKKTPAGQHSKVQDFFSDDSGAYGGWKDVELSRRRSNTLAVCNTVISRVIGRGGANINAIREATGASIEVEKQNTRRDQLERLICIRGTAETVRNATCMINGLIADTEITVNDVIRQVLRGNTSVASSSSESERRIVSEPKSMATATTVKSNTAATAAPTTTNVWQQRMAARAAMQAQTKEPTTSPSPAAPEPIASPKLPPAEEPTPEPRQPSPIVSPSIPAAAVVVPPPPPAYNTEEELRKAPGYRPHTAPSAVAIETAADGDKHETLEEKTLPPIGQGFPRAPGTKINSDEAIKSASSREFSSLSFLEKPEIADIWKGDGKDSSNEPAWGGQILLGNGLSNMLGGLRVADWTDSRTITSNADFAAIPSSSSSTTATTSKPATSQYDWIGSNTMPQSNPLYSRQTSTRAPTLPTPTSSSMPPTSREALFQQLAAQLLNQQNGQSTQQSNNYYPSQYSENLSQPSATHKSYLQAYQNANQEYENLSNLLNSYSNAQHYNNTNGDYRQGYPSSPATSRSMPTRPSTFGAPPGFANVTPTAPGLNSNPAMTPPHLRQYYNGPTQNNSFSAYAQSQQQQNNWSKLNSNTAPGSSWNSGGWN